MEQRVQVAIAALLDCLADLVREHLVVGGAFDRAEYADRNREVRPFETRERERVGGRVVPFVVDRDTGCDRVLVVAESTTEGMPFSIRMPCRCPFEPVTSGCPSSSTSAASLRVFLFSTSIHSLSLKTGQFWRISTKAVPLCSWARRRVCCRCFASTSMVRATKVAPAPRAKEIGSIGVVDRAVRRRLRLHAGASEVGEYCPLVSP